METLPAGKGTVISPPVGERDNALITRQYENRNVLYKAYENKDYALIALFGLLGEAYGYKNLLEAAKLLRENDLGDLVSSLNDTQASAFVSFRSTVTDTLCAGYDGSADFPVYRLKMDRLRLQTNSASLHILMIPEDGVILESIVRQGIFDEEKIRIMLYEIKDGTLASVISDGFL
jgi:hypothetical protein